MKTGTKVLIGVGVLGVGAYWLYRRSVDSRQSTVDSGQSTVDSGQSKNTLDHLLETLPAPTKAPATEAQQAQTQKVIAMLNQQSTVDSRPLTVLAPPPALKVMDATMQMNTKSISPQSIVYTSPTIDYQPSTDTAIKTATLVSSGTMRVKPMLQGFNLLR